MEDQFGGRKLVEQVTVLAYLAQKVIGQLPALPNRLCCQWMHA